MAPTACHGDAALPAPLCGSDGVTRHGWSAMQDLLEWRSVSSGAAALSCCRKHEADTRSLRIDCGRGGRFGIRQRAGRADRRVRAVRSLITREEMSRSILRRCTAGITPVQQQQIIDDVLARRAIPPELLERSERLARQLGVSDTALKNFFRILGEQKVPIEDLDAKLREIAARHLTLLKQVETLSGEDPQVDALKKAAVASIAAGDYARAEVAAGTGIRCRSCRCRARRWISPISGMSPQRRPRRIWVNSNYPNCNTRQRHGSFRRRPIWCLRASR